MRLIVDSSSAVTISSSTSRIAFLIFSGGSFSLVSMIPTLFDRAIVF